MLDPILQKYMEQMRRQRFFDTIGQIGQGIMAAGSRGAGFGNALAQGLANAGGGRGRGGGRGGGNDMLDMLRLQGTLDRRRQDQEAQRRARGQHASQEALGAGDRYDPQSGVLWNTPPAPGREPAPATPVQRESLLARAYPEAVGKARVAEAFPAPVEYNVPTTVLGPDGKPTLVRFPRKGAGGPAEVAGYKPYTKPSEITPAQQSSNAEIDQARATLDRRGLDKAEISRRTQKTKNTGRVNQQYDEGLDRIVRMATQRKTGPDPDYRRYFGTYLGGVELSEPAGMAPLPPGVSAEEPGFIERAGDYLFGGDTAPSGAGAAEADTAPKENDSPVRPLPLTTDRRVHEGRLVVGQTYETADGTIWRWTGQNFIQVE